MRRPLARDHHTTNRRLVSRRHAQRWLVRPVSCGTRREDNTGARNHSAAPESAHDFRAAPAFASLERTHSPHVCGTSDTQVGCRKRMGRAGYSLDRTRAEMESEPRRSRGAHSQFPCRGSPEASARPRVRLRAAFAWRGRTHHLPLRANRDGAFHAALARQLSHGALFFSKAGSRHACRKHDATLFACFRKRRCLTFVLGSGEVPPALLRASARLLFGATRPFVQLRAVAPMFSIYLCRVHIPVVL